ncbi:hypothetical protein CA13_73020 [Planctomycetes bacterium CA13]|uniref:Uncharacterized protein n=2 Tax=Novipirellula herctigrandis TaxID=2527986 RepID=A0A5C5YPK4_9BACT|nr:hypothetical protein CA13_73020 [Planctomycetes bacterium CA13]
MFASSGRQERIERSRQLIMNQQQDDDGLPGETTLPEEPSFDPPLHQSICPQCERPRRTVQTIDPALTMSVLALASLLHEATSQQIASGLDTASVWLKLLARVVRDQTRRGTSNTLILALYRGWISPHDPVMDAVRIRYAELIAGAAASPRGPPPQQREAA